jgi:hypothetical protein
MRRGRRYGRDRGAFEDAEESSFERRRRIFTFPARNCELKRAVTTPSPLTSFGSQCLLNGTTMTRPNRHIIATKKSYEAAVPERHQTGSTAPVRR